MSNQQSTTLRTVGAAALALCVATAAGVNANEGATDTAAIVSSVNMLCGHHAMNVCALQKQCTAESDASGYCNPLSQLKTGCADPGMSGMMGCGNLSDILIECSANVPLLKAKLDKLTPIEQIGQRVAFNVRMSISGMAESMSNISTMHDHDMSSMPSPGSMSSMPSSGSMPNTPSSNMMDPDDMSSMPSSGSMQTSSHMINAHSSVDGVTENMASSGSAPEYDEELFHLLHVEQMCTAPVLTLPGTNESSGITIPALCQLSDFGGVCGECDQDTNPNGCLQPVEKQIQMCQSDFCENNSECESLCMSFENVCDTAVSATTQNVETLKPWCSALVAVENPLMAGADLSMLNSASSTGASLFVAVAGVVLALMF